MQTLERMAVAIEKLGEDPVIEMEAGPPICPHCQTHNPGVTVQEEESSGPLSEFLLVMKCHSCGADFYAVPFQWQMFTDLDSVREEMEARKNVSNGN